MTNSACALDEKFLEIAPALCASAITAARVPRSEQLRGQVDRGSRQGLGHRAIPLRIERIPLEGLVVEAGNFRRRLQVDPADGERVADLVQGDRRARVDPG